MNNKSSFAIYNGIFAKVEKSIQSGLCIRNMHTNEF